ncbi:lipopolysaccharide export system protein LptC [Pseudooceanicola antarcticus]|uniref:Lipopolysaccharide export system protein LptC n=1 Tax=Pseudooceanicola antarcticus TaxID=1247613 RepID=A0A285HRI3_9RHOB|nr:hypothetical protein [Pseudooceanicola antarcticus]PJE27630.1 hypothetical protein CVM39_13685 [Pseudooceanicola antarcticus]SNY38294.1 lipopolysaccharide export system protein LptC [Pseudooceanicola antarcticus]
MAVSEASRARYIRWLKIALPLAAMALLSTLFLLSDNADPMAEIPFSTIDLEESARSQRVTRPSFAGASAEGDLIAFTAAEARPRDDNRLDATELNARIDMTSGNGLDVSAATGLIDQPADTATLAGGVLITTTTGYRIQTEEIDMGMKALRAQTAGEIRAEGPPGRFTAGRMELTTDPETGKPYLVFTQGVKLVYLPGTTEE